ncbi:hypothetical protein B7494_g8072 [Chlorociboria aeruginascens]|nr:hypothetical protein B7494_g8072 [Chlorociboria aeruginascens]
MPPVHLTVVASLATYNPITNGPSYAVGIPDAGSDIYFQLSAPSSYQWVGLGIGEQMAGATIFVMYADGTGNVTISGREGGQGHVEPQHNSSLAVSLLAGSGVADNLMVANVLCKNCNLLSSTTSTSSPWIAAWRQGDALDSTSTSFTITQHDIDNTRQFTFDLSQASISSDSNPFISAATTSSVSAPAASVSSFSSSTTESGDDDMTVDYEKAHGIIMGVTVVLLFPMGAMFMRVVGHPWLHGILQLFSLCMLFAGFGIGIKLAKITSNLYNNTHTIFGTVIVALFLLQPFFGILHHSSYKKVQKRGIFSYMHIWYGRILIILAVINGGLGLKLAANTTHGEIAYGVVAGVMFLIYLAVFGATSFRKRSKAASKDENELREINS